MTVEWWNPRPMSDVYTQHPVCDVWPIWGWGCPVSQCIILGPADGCRRLDQIWFGAVRHLFKRTLILQWTFLTARVDHAFPHLGPPDEFVCQSSDDLFHFLSTARLINLFDVVRNRGLPFKAAWTTMQRNDSFAQSYFCAQVIGSNTSYTSAFTRLFSSSDRVKRSGRSKYPIKFSSVILTDELARSLQGLKDDAICRGCFFEKRNLQKRKTHSNLRRLEKDAGNNSQANSSRGENQHCCKRKSKTTLRPCMTLLGHTISARNRGALLCYCSLLKCSGNSKRKQFLG